MFFCFHLCSRELGKNIEKWKKKKKRQENNKQLLMLPILPVLILKLLTFFYLKLE